MSELAKILIITNSYPNRYKPYAGKYVERHVLLHAETGLDVAVLTSGDSRQGLFRSFWKYIKLALQVLRMFFADFDLVHAHWELPSGLFGLVLSRLRRKPFLLTSHGAFTDKFESRSWLTRRLVQTVLHQADRVIVVGQEQKRKVELIGNLPDRSVMCIDMGVWLPQSLPKREDARKILNLPLEKKVVVFIGNLLQRKGVDILVKAVATLLETKIHFLVFIGGQGPEKQYVFDLVDQLGLKETVHVVGAVLPEDVFTWFSAADVCVIPSRTEPFGLVAVEAMACGTAVIAADVGGLSENITHGKNGLLFPVGDHVALAKCLQEVLISDELRQRLGDQGYETAAVHNMRLQANKVRDVYLELLNRGVEKVSMDEPCRK